jgi:cytochrome c oxidase cbb3-type subunit IV
MNMELAMDINTLRSLVTAAGFALFIGIAVWAYRPARKRAFDEAANLPFSKEASHQDQKDLGKPS